MENNLEETSSTMSGQGQTLKYLIDFGQKIKSYFKEFITLHSNWKDLENKIRKAICWLSGYGSAGIGSRLLPVSSAASSGRFFRARVRKLWSMGQTWITARYYTADYLRMFFSFFIFTEGS